MDDHMRPGEKELIERTSDELRQVVDQIGAIPDGLSVILVGTRISEEPRLMGQSMAAMGPMSSDGEYLVRLLGRVVFTTEAKHAFTTEPPSHG